MERYVDSVKLMLGDGSNDFRGGRKHVDGQFGDDWYHRWEVQTDIHTDRHSTHMHRHTLPLMFLLVFPPSNEG